MPTIRTTDALAIGGAVANALAGSVFEFVQTATRVQVFAVAEGAGIGELEIFFGQELELSQSPPNIVAAGGGGPRIPDDELVDDIAAPGDRIVVRLVETGGAAVVTMRTVVKLTPLPRRR